MTSEIAYSVSKGCGGTIFFGLTEEGEIYADLGGSIFTCEEMLEDFANDCETTLEDIRELLEKAARKTNKPGKQTKKPRVKKTK